MSAEIFAIVISAVGVVAAVLGGMFGGARFLLSRIDRRFDAFGIRVDERFAASEKQIDEKFAAQDKRIDEKFAAQDERIDEKFAAQDKRIDEKFAAQERWISERFATSEERIVALRDEIAGLRTELRATAADVVDLKIAVARIEGPKPRLLPAR